MKLFNYLTEGDIYYPESAIKNNIEKYEQMIAKDCKPYLNILRKGGIPLLRGVGDWPAQHLFKKKSFIGKGRKPKDMPKDIHEYLNKKILEMVGWPMRDGVSTTIENFQASAYGRSMLFFPIGKFEWAFFQKIFDLYAKLNSAFKSRGENEHRKAKKALEMALVKDALTDEGLAKFKQDVDIWWKIAVNSMKAWNIESNPERGIETPKELFDVIDGVLEMGKLQKNKPWNQHDGEIMINCKEYYLFDFYGMGPEGTKVMLTKLGITNWKKMPGVEYRSKTELKALGA
jgi:hypothetical protein